MPSPTNLPPGAPTTSLQCRYTPGIHPSSVIHPAVKMPEGMSVGPFCTIGEYVKFLGPCRLHERVSIHGRATIGEGCEFFPGAVIGTIPQDLKYSGEVTEIRIGSNNIFREYVTAHLGTPGGGGVTTVGDHNLFMAYVHIAHDCHVGSRTVFANTVGLSGHVEVGDWAIIGGMTGVIQFARIGMHAHVGGQMRITKDVVPFCRVAGDDRVRIIGVNSIGLSRRGFDETKIKILKDAVRTLLSPKLTTAQAVAEIEKQESSDEVKHMVEFIKTSRIGIHQ